MHKLRHKRESYGLTVAELSERSDISIGVIYRIEGGNNPYRVNETTAYALAAALAVPVGEIFDLRTEISGLGRPPHTGKPIGRLRLVGEHETVCSSCHLMVPRAIGCLDCAA